MGTFFIWFFRPLLFNAPPEYSGGETNLSSRASAEWRELAVSLPVGRQG